MTDNWTYCIILVMEKIVCDRGKTVENRFYQELCQTVGKINVLLEEPMWKHTTFRVGGNAAYFVTPESPEEVKNVIKVCRENQMPFYVIGNGSNLLVSDEGFSGVIIQICSKMDCCEVKEGTIKVQAGALLTKIANRISKEGYTGLEFAVGIPGTIGGAVAMNAGAYGGEIKDVITNALVLTKQGEMIRLNKEELKLGYRSSAVMEQEHIVLEVEFQLEKGDVAEILAVCNKNTKARMEKQPLEYPSAGSTFKRPEGYFAGKLIMDAGMQGYTVGGAQVSEKHCGFIINKGEATASEVTDLIARVQKKVKETFGVTLETEVKMIGFEKL